MVWRKYTHHTFTPIIKLLITTTANKYGGGGGGVHLTDWWRESTVCAQADVWVGWGGVGGLTLCAFD